MTDRHTVSQSVSFWGNGSTHKMLAEAEFSPAAHM